MNRYSNSFFFALLLAASLAHSVAATTVEVDKDHNSVLIVTDTNAIQLQPWSARTVRVEIAPGKTIPEKKSLAVIATANPAGWAVTENPDSVQLKGPKLCAVVNKQTGLVSFLDATGKALLTQSAVAFSPARNATRDGLDLSATFLRSPGEHFYGGGVLNNLRSESVEIGLANNNTEVRIPVLYSTCGYGFFWDNASRGKLCLTPQSVTWDSSAGDLVDFYVFAAPTADSAIAEYRNLTGRAPLFPEWAYGFWFSKNKFNSQQEILAAAQTFRSHQFPIDLLVQDYFYWKPNGATDNAAGWGSHHFVEERYPDVKGMIDQLHNQDHIHFMCVIWAKFNPDTDHFKELQAANGLFPPNKDWASPYLQYYDPYQAKAREIYGKQVVESLLPIGVDAFWMDGAEPEMGNNTFAAFDSPTGPVSRVMDAFPLMHTTSVYEAQRKATDQKRVVLLPRSAWAGEQRNAAANWTGDIYQDWTTLAWQVEGLQNYSIAGLPYITTDVGGYSGTAESDGELYVRWSQAGTFFPLDRTHGAPRPFPWEYGAEDEAILKKFAMLRYRLMPYIYTQAAQITLQNGTLMRPLVMDFQEDLKALEIGDEFLFGPSIMVCPVIKPARESAAALDQWADLQGKTGGLTIAYLQSETDAAAGTRVDLIGDYARSIQHGKFDEVKMPADCPDTFAPVTGGKAKLIRIEGTYLPKETGNFDLQVTGNGRPTAPATVTINGKPVTSPMAGSDWNFPLYPFSAQSGKLVDFTIKTSLNLPGLRIVHELSGAQHRDVYLPGKGDWYDFWTGQRTTGSQTISVETPLDRIPLYVRAGSILPMGPEIQYVGEKPADPIELRVYRGADGAFTLYEDEGDSYNYEKGAFAQIPMTWNEASQTLTIGDRRGNFPGMLAKRKFQVVWVGSGHGGGEGPIDKPDATVTYEGKAVTVKAP